MKGIDHKCLGIQVADQFPEHTTRLERKLFVLGCVQPDWNVFTYLRGSMRTRKIRGHHYPNIRNVVEKYMVRLSGKARFRKCDYYRLGKLFHYAADAFTFPHNEEFQGNIHEHMAYEQKFHLLLKEHICLLGGRQVNWQQKKNGAELFECFEWVHAHYLRVREDMRDDLNYIDQMAFLVSGMIV